MERNQEPREVPEGDPGRGLTDEDIERVIRQMERELGFEDLF